MRIWTQIGYHQTHNQKKKKKKTSFNHLKDSFFFFFFFLISNLLSTSSANPTLTARTSTLYSISTGFKLKPQLFYYFPFISLPSSPIYCHHDSFNLWNLRQGQQQHPRCAAYFNNKNYRHDIPLGIVDKPLFHETRPREPNAKLLLPPPSRRFM